MRAALQYPFAQVALFLPKLGASVLLWKRIAYGMKLEGFLKASAIQCMFSWDQRAPGNKQNESDGLKIRVLKSILTADLKPSAVILMFCIPRRRWLQFQPHGMPCNSQADPSVIIGHSSVWARFVNLLKNKHTSERVYTVL